MSLPRRTSGSGFHQVERITSIPADVLSHGSLSQISDRSLARRRESAWFRQLAEESHDSWLASRRSWIPLERSKFEALRVKAREASGHGVRLTSDIERTPYLDEVLAIAADYFESSASFGK